MPSPVFQNPFRPAEKQPSERTQRLIAHLKAQRDARFLANKKTLLRRYCRARFAFEDLADAGADVCAITVSDMGILIQLHLPPPSGLVAEQTVVSRAPGHRRIVGKFQGVPVTWIQADPIE